MQVRLQKLLAQAGLCSRRRAEAYLRSGAVSVNGVPAHLGQRADPQRDDIRLEGRPLPGREEYVYLMVNKPPGYVTTVRDERGRRTVMELLRGVAQRVYPVGRLDCQSQGLVLLTNDGDLAQRLLHPRHGVEKEYRVTVSGPAEDAAGRLAAVQRVDGVPISRPQVRLIRQLDPHRAVLQVILRQGRNRQIRKMCAQCGLDVLRLQRIREGGLMLGDLPPGAWRYLTQREVSALRRSGASGDGCGKTEPS